MSDEDKESLEVIEVPEWAGHGTGLLRRRSGLPWYHKDSTYNYIMNVLKKVPEDFGVFADRCGSCGHIIKPNTEDL